MYILFLCFKPIPTHSLSIYTLYIPPPAIVFYLHSNYHTTVLTLPRVPFFFFSYQYCVVLFFLVFFCCLLLFYIVHLSNQPDELKCILRQDHNMHLSIAFTYHPPLQPMYSRSTRALWIPPGQRVPGMQSVTMAAVDPGMNDYTTSVASDGSTVSIALKEKKLTEEMDKHDKQQRKHDQTRQCVRKGTTPAHARGKAVRHKQRRRQKRNRNKKRQIRRRNNNKKKNYRKKRRKCRCHHLRRLRSSATVVDRVIEAHRTIVSHLCHYDVVLWPKFPYASLLRISRRHPERNLSAKLRRKLKAIAHGALRRRLAAMAQERGTLLLFANESFTTRCCARCGALNNNVGRNRTFTCSQNNCNHVCPRDVNAAFNIFIRGMGLLVDLTVGNV